jgi:thiosulfate dehydrogenase
MRTLARRCSWFLAVGLLFGCTSPDGPVVASVFGEELFGRTDFSDSQFNVFSCATCHAATAPKAGPRIGSSLRNSAFRTSWWNGYTPRLLDAVNSCYVFFMRGAPLDPTDPRARALYEYLVRISPERGSPATPLTLVEKITDLPRGQAARGKAVYEEVCAPCHGDPHSGRGRLADFVAIVPEASLGFAGQFGADPAEVVIEKVRHGQFFGVGGNMPFFSREALSDEDLGAILTYVGL